MEIIGKVTSTTTFETRGNTISIFGVPEELVGNRVRLDGLLRCSNKKGAYYRVIGWSYTDEPDNNKVIVSGIITRIYQPWENPHGKKTACILLQQNDKGNSVVKVTAVDSKIDELGLDNLSIGQEIRLSGYITYHKRGLHVLYVESLGKEEKE